MIRWPLIVACLSAATSAVYAQPAPAGYVSLFADRLPNRDATELRARIFAEEKVDAGSRVRLVASGFVEGLLAGRDGAAVRDAAAEAHELTATLRTRRVDVTAGFGRVVWGRLDELQPTDVVNPLDVSRFFFEGRGEARLAVPLVRATVYAGERASVEGVYVPFFRRGRFDRLDEPTSPFAIGPGVPFTERAPERTAGNAQGGVRANFTSGRVDWSVSAYRGFRPFGIYAAADPLTVERVYPRFTMLGGDFETVFGAWAVRGEAAAFTRDAFQPQAPGPAPTGSSFDAGGGVDRKAGEYRISGQVLLHRESDDAAPDSRTDVSLIVSADRTFARQKYEGRLFGVYNPTSGAAFVRAIARANLRDNVALEGSIGAFAGEGTDNIGRFADSDFAYVRLKYSF
ncbi:MAG TPA: DUF1302 family protein [Vicinamibacterales bacterium]|nr:DUF1302 family protein [Vicinamibacterales bacterium]